MDLFAQEILTEKNTEGFVKFMMLSGCVCVCVQRARATRV